MRNENGTWQNDKRISHFLVVHPLDDVPETKVDIGSAGPYADDAQRAAVLMSLRAYLVLMVLLVVYHVVMLAR